MSWPVQCQISATATTLKLTTVRALETIPTNDETDVSSRKKTFLAQGTQVRVFL